MVEKPTWKLGSKSYISLKTTSKIKHDSVRGHTSVPTAWKIAGDEDDLDLIDDDELLTEEDLKRTQTVGRFQINCIGGSDNDIK